MARSSNPSEAIRLLIDANHPELLRGLDHWLRLGLLTDAEVREIGATKLACPIPQWAPQPVARAQTSAPSSPEPATLSSPTPSSPRQTQRGILAQAAEALIGELSVVWLLFLGLFLVIVSSGVLAASQWRNVPPVGQYAILLSYTVAFWGASAWTQKRPALKLTHQMLRVATLLLIPVNFWMMDGLMLWRQAAGWGVMAIASLFLSGVMVSLLHNATNTSATNRLRYLNGLGLSWLHWGWSWGTVPLLATYLGIMGTALSLVLQAEASQFLSPTSSDSTSAETRSPMRELFSPGNGAIALSTLLLMGRAALVAGVPFHQLGLALGICGWLVCWLSRRPLSRALWKGIGAGFMLLGWLLSVTTLPPWQAIAISGLGIGLLADRLKRLARLSDVTLIGLIGLQILYLVWNTFPAEGRQQLIRIAIQLAGSEGMPEAAIGVVVFPYIWLWLGLARQFRQWQQPALAAHTELLTFILGLGLTVLGANNPLARSLTLLLSTVTLLLWMRRHPSIEPPLVYITHLTTLATLGSVIDLAFPDLSLRVWAGLLLTGMAIEWAWGRGRHPDAWHQSTWPFGLGMAGLSYWLLLNDSPFSSHWALMWLAVPLGLTALSKHRPFQHTVPALTLSGVGLVLAQLLTLWDPTPRLVGLGSATLLMVINTGDRTTERGQTLSAGITIGFALAFAAAGLDLAIADWSFSRVQLVIAIAAAVMWLIRQGTLSRSPALSRCYAIALDGWAIALSSLSLISVSGYTLYRYLSPDWVSGVLIAAALTTSLALGLRVWQAPTNWGFWGIAWGVELVTALLCVTAASPIKTLAIANLALGLLTQLWGDAWIWRTHQPYFLSWHWIPLVYAVLGLGLGHSSFTAQTGLYTLAASVVGVAVGRRLPMLRPLTLLSLGLLSLAAYELLIYQLLQVSGGQPGDGIALLAGLAALFALGYRVVSPWTQPYLRLSRSTLQTLADVHWGLGLVMSGVALSAGLSTTGGWLWSSTTTVLSGYGLAIGNRLFTLSAHENDPRSRSLQEVWTCLGIVAAIAVFTDRLYHLFPDHQSFWAWAGMVYSGVGAVLYPQPWKRWGWSERPWQGAMMVLPGVMILLSLADVNLQSLWLGAAFYAWLAHQRQQTRLSYLSLIFIDWAWVRFLLTRDWLEPIWVSSILGGSLLYIAQVDPSLQNSSAKSTRHLLRCLATGLICVTAFYQTEVTQRQPQLWLLIGLTFVLSLGLIAAGLVVKVRAFLFVGTLTFISMVVRQVWLLIDPRPMTLWAVGIVVGLIFVWIAATFEARRSQVNTFMTYWLDELQQWQ